MSQTSIYDFLKPKKKKRQKEKPEQVIFPASHIYDESKPCKHPLVGKEVRYRGIKAEVLWARKHPTWGVFLRIKTGPIAISGSECGGMETSVWAEDVDRT
jgi:hypothetical protein